MRLLPGVLQLPENLGLAQHQRIQSAGYADQVTCRILALVGVKMPVELAGRDSVGLVDPLQQRLFPGPG